jgi:YidC/Oxa1 family membrane protein insertase
MDQARLFIAIALSIAVFLAWEMFFVEKPIPPGPGQPTTVQETDVAPASPEAPPSSVSSGKTTVAEPAPPPVPVLESEPVRDILVETPLILAVISEDGGIVKSLQLKKYRQTTQPDSPQLEMVPSPDKYRVGQLSSLNNGISGLSDARFQADTDRDRLLVDTETEQLIMRWVSKEGLVVEKVFRFHPGQYQIGLMVRVINQSGRTVKDRVGLRLDYVPENSNRTYAFVGPSCFLNGRLEQIDIDDIEEQPTLEGEIHWNAVQNRYFISSVVPDEAVNGMVKLSLINKTDVRSILYAEAFTLAPQEKWEHGYQVFLGPKRTQYLEQVGHELAAAIDFGMFDFLAKPCLWLMNKIYTVIPNYGVAIILLTLLIKIVLWPLGNKSYKSMNEMKRIQPLMTEIREKYKGDKKKMNEEVMGLYRTYKVNPMGGCFPMLLQIPVFFALYRMLYEAIELRHAPFIGWINDLSAPDRLFHFGFSIPLMEPPYGIPVLTIVMGGTMFLQQKMSPPPGDPTQAKVMMLMPVVFTFIFINFSSGLVLYWLINNILSIGQQYYIQKKYA